MSSSESKIKAEPKKTLSPIMQLWAGLGKKYGVPRKGTEEYDKKKAEFEKAKKKLLKGAKEAEKVKDKVKDKVKNKSKKGKDKLESE
jgi:hypothetical protein